MQAQLLRLDTLGERLAKLAGFRPQDLMFGQTPGRGGAVSSHAQPGPVARRLADQLDAADAPGRRPRRQARRARIAADLSTARKKSSCRPMLPVRAGWHSSNFGWRIDPFSGQQAFHEGIDFMADAGHGDHAAAGGVVVYSDFHPQYGNMIEIDHGNDLVSRYAHASKLLVKVGDVVLSGAKIAEVGRTGRSTGTHLHFEVRHRGVPQNPAQLSAAARLRPERLQRITRVGASPHPFFYERGTRFAVQTMIQGVLKKIFGSRNERLLKQYGRTVRAINALEPRSRSSATSSCGRRPTSSASAIQRPLAQAGSRRAQATNAARRRAESQAALDRGGAKRSTRCCPKRSRWCAKPASACSTCATSTCS